MKRQNHPAINDKPPTGVTTPSGVILGPLAAFMAVIAYRDPENKKMPQIKNTADQ